MPDTNIGNPADDLILTLTNKVSDCVTTDCVVGAGNTVDSKINIYSPWRKIIDNTRASISTSSQEGSITNNPNTGARGRDRGGPCYTMSATAWEKAKKSEAENLASCGNVVAVGGHVGSITLTVTLTYKYILEAPTATCGSVVTSTKTFTESLPYGSNEHVRPIGQSEQFIRYKEHRCGNTTGRLCGGNTTVSFSYACPSCCKIAARCGYPCSDPNSSVCQPVFSDAPLEGNRLFGGGSYADLKDDPDFGPHITDIRNLVFNSYKDAWDEIIAKFGAWIKGHQPPSKLCSLISKEYTGVSYKIS